MACRARAGFSLMEVLLAVGILLACAIVLGDLAGVGRRHATSAEAMSTSQLFCQTKLNEIVSGATPATTVQNQPIAELPGWLYSIEVESLGQFDLARLRVTVWQQPRHNEADAAGATSSDRKHQFSLVRWIPDPARGATGTGPTSLLTESLLRPLSESGLLRPDDGGFGADEATGWEGGIFGGGGPLP